LPVGEKTVKATAVCIAVKALNGRHQDKPAQQLAAPRHISGLSSIDALKYIAA
jgi:hypothetical protein